MAIYILMTVLTIYSKLWLYTRCRKKAEAASGMYALYVVLDVLDVDVVDVLDICFPISSLADRIDRQIYWFFFIYFSWDLSWEEVKDISHGQCSAVTRL